MGADRLGTLLSAGEDAQRCAVVAHSFEHVVGTHRVDPTKTDAAGVHPQNRVRLIN
jgi:hypothetical protein